MKLPLLPGTADGKHWSLSKDSDGCEVGGMAIFALGIQKNSLFKVVGTGFYISNNGIFITAKHVAEELISASLKNAFIVNLMPGDTYLLRPISKFDLHPRSDVAIGQPVTIEDHRTNSEYIGKRLLLSFKHPNIGDPIANWSYPRHSVTYNYAETSVFLEPDFYDGTVEEFFGERGPSRLTPPYFQTNMHIHGSASGGPVFSADGLVFGIASTSYSSATDLSFVTPLSSALDMTIVGSETPGGPEVEFCFGDFARNAGLIA